MDAPGDILVFHPGKQHAYEVVAALQSRDRLAQFVTGVYDTPGSWVRAGARILPLVVPRYRASDVLAKRRDTRVYPQNVTSWPAGEIFARTVGASKLLRMLTGDRCGHRLASWYGDRSLASALQRRRFRPSAVYAFLGAARHTFAACKRLGIKTILDVPTTLSMKLLREERDALAIRTEASISAEHVELELSRADTVIVPSAHVAETVLAKGYSKPIQVVPFGVDLECFNPGRGSGHFRVIYAGRLELGKGVHYLVDAWRAAAVPGELVLAGSAPDSAFLRFLRRGYSESVREAGNLSRSNLARLLSSADVFVLPSLAEGSALVTYEALASGLPSIVTAESGSVVRDGIEGFIVPARDSRSIAERLKQLHADGALRGRMALAARSRAEQFSWESYGTRLVAAIDSGLAATAAQTSSA